MRYADKLLTTEWRSKREEILKRDGYRCHHCYSQSDLQIHHKYYTAGAEPWDYPDDCFVTLCEYCHTSHHLDTWGEKGIDQPPREGSGPVHISTAIISFLEGLVDA